MQPGYLKLHERGDLEERISLLSQHYSACSLCPHRCGSNRLDGQTGICRSGPLAKVASYNTHRGEEPPVSGYEGSGTIFFSGCSGRCIFCQNYPISQLNTGNQVSEKRLAGMMLELQKRGCHNINLVTPTHFLPSIVQAISIAAQCGLRLPIVYNTSGYERVETLRLLDGIVDIYLPDIKYMDDTIASELSGFTHYTVYNQAALKEMFRQVGNLEIVDGIAVKGIIIRHLILPDNLSGTCDAMAFLTNELSPDVYISLMDQYFPAYKAQFHPHLSRRITLHEYDAALDDFERNALHNGWIQEHVAP